MNTLPIHPHEAVPHEAVRIGTSCFSFASLDGRTVFHGTGLGMVYELLTDGAEPGKEGSRKLIGAERKDI